MTCFIRFICLSARFLFAAQLLSALLPHAVETQVAQLTHGDVKRRYITYLPASYAASGDRRYPVVLHYHGGGMTMAEQMLYTRMNEAADRHDFIVVYPQGIDQDWNVGFGMPYAEGTDDVGFTEAILDHLTTTFRVDTTRLYATGLSRGGFFTHRLAAELSHRLAAIASVGASLPVPVQEGHRPQGPRAPIGVMQVHGTADQVVMYAGKAGHYLSAVETHAWWVARNGLERAGTTTRELDDDPADGTRITVETAERERQVTVLVTIHEGGHTWAGADPFNMGLPIGRTSRDIDLNEMIWRFFAGHRRQ